LRLLYRWPYGKTPLILEQDMEKLETITITPVKLRPLPSATRADNEGEVEDVSCTLLYEYVVTDPGDDDDAPTCEVTKVIADFGGRKQVLLRWDVLGREVQEMLEDDASDREVAAQAARDEDYRQRLTGGL
jgi:hypothetical protein